MFAEKDVNGKAWWKRVRNTETLSENVNSGLMVSNSWLTTMKLSNSGKQNCNKGKSSLN